MARPKVENISPETKSPVKETVEVLKVEHKIENPAGKIPEEKLFKSYWGVDSYDPANWLVGSQLLYDNVLEKYGRKPDFWGRYIGGAGSATVEELKYLHSKGVAVLLIYNPLDNSIVSQGYATGVSHANRAINAAQALLVKPGVLIGFDNESGWNLSSDFIGGWMDTFRNSPFYKGSFIYANAQSDTNFLYAYQEAWKRYTSVSSQKPFGMIWSSEPEIVGGGWPAPDWNPSYPPENAIGTTIWQYTENVDNGLVDCNLCSKAAFDLMYQPFIQYQIIKTCALKPEPPNHESHSILTLYGGVKVEFISEETFTDPVTHKTEPWLHVKAAKANTIVTGWLPKVQAQIINS